MNTRQPVSHQFLQPSMFSRLICAFFFVYKINNIKCINVDPDRFKNNQIQFHTGHITHFEKITFRKNNCDRARALLTTFVWRGGGGGGWMRSHTHMRADLPLMLEFAQCGK